MGLNAVPKVVPPGLLRGDTHPVRLHVWHIFTYIGLASGCVCIYIYHTHICIYDVKYIHTIIYARQVSEPLYTYPLHGVSGMQNQDMEPGFDDAPRNNTSVLP